MSAGRCPRVGCRPWAAQDPLGRSPRPQPLASRTRSAPWGLRAPGDAAEGFWNSDRSPIPQVWGFLANGRWSSKARRGTSERGMC